MIDKKINNTVLINRLIQHNKLIKRIVLDKKSNCEKYYKNSLVQKNLGNNRDFGDCEIFKIITEISIDTKNFKNFIKEAKYKLLDQAYGPDEFQFFVQKLK